MPARSVRSQTSSFAELFDAIRQTQEAVERLRATAAGVHTSIHQIEDTIHEIEQDDARSEPCSPPKP